MIRLTLIAAAIVLGACASTDAVNDPDFQRGYDTGCAMAHSSREANRALTEGKPELYRRGFAAGFSACGGNSRSPTRDF